MASRRGKEPQPLRLRSVGPGGAATLLLRPGENRFGTSGGNDLVVSLEGVSREHAVLDWRGDEVHVRDLDSTNGTFLNRRRIQAGVARAGDTLVFGPAVFLLEHGEAADTTLALPAVDTPQSSTTRRRTPSTPTACEDVVPASWLVQLAAAVEAHQEAAPAEILEWLRRMTQATTVTLMATDDTGVPVVLAHAGTADDVLLEEVRSLAIATAGTPDAFVRGTVLPSSSAGLVLHARSDRGRLHVLAVRSTALPPAQVASLAHVFASFIGGRLVPADHLPRRDRRKTDLVFPPGSVRCPSEAMRHVYEQLSVVAASDLPILICGETGVGKEHIARLIHASSTRRAGPFVAINCTAIPGELLEAELFGIEAGVATGVTGRVGTLVRAGGGTVFLDEIADMTPSLQAKLLRVIEASEVFPVGARRPVPLDVRIVSATNADLAARRAEGRFRPDLYHRLAGIAITIPPLRDRRADLPDLAQHFVTVLAAKYAVAVQGVTLGALNLLMSHPWEGNVRELEKVIERLVLACQPKQPITAAMARTALGRPVLTSEDSDLDPDGDLTLARYVAQAEKEAIAAALAHSGGQIAPAARILGITRQTLRTKMRTHGFAAHDE